ncbi:MAG: hypothetical protein D6698_03610, partial [Gammaproteobacteria bacterium]
MTRIRKILAILTLASTLAVLASHPASAAGIDQNIASQAMNQGNYGQVKTLITPLAKSGIPWAQMLLAQLYEQGLGIPKDSTQALSWLKKAAAANYPEAQFKLGMYYLDHLHELPDARRQAEDLFATIAESSQKLRRQLFYSSKAAYIKGDYEKAFILADPAARFGDSDAQFLIGVMFDKGQGVPVYQPEAIKWYLKAAKQDHGMAQLYLAIKYDRGDGVSRDEKESFAWYLKAARHDLLQAMVRLSDFYAQGLGTEKDPAQSIVWLKKAAEKGSAEAMKKMAYHYANGLGVKQSRYNAADWYYRAGHTFFEQGDKEEALASIEAIESLVPNHFLSKRLLNEIYNPNLSSTSQDVNAESGNTVYGTAWVLSSHYVVTAYHVLEGRQKISLMTQDNREIHATLVVFDHANDLAILRVTPTLTPLPLGQDLLSLGDDVFTIGYPEPDLLGKKAKYTTGKVNSVFGFRDDPRFVQVSTPIHS